MKFKIGFFDKLKPLLKKGLLSNFLPIINYKLLYKHSLWRDEISRHDYEVVNRHLINLSQQIADSAKGCPKRTELMYGNTTAAHGERRIHRTALALIQGGCERNVHPFAGTEQIVQYRQVLPKWQRLQIIHIVRYELTERFVRSVDEGTKCDSIKWDTTTVTVSESTNRREE